MKTGFLISLGLILPLLLFGRKIEVCKSCDFLTIQSALDVAEDGDTVLVFEGIYLESNIIINKSIHVLGINYPILDGESKNAILSITAPDVLVKGFFFKNVPTSYIDDKAAIRVVKTQNFTIEDNKLYNTFFGIYIEHSNYGKILGNEVIGTAEKEMSSGNAIHLWYCNNIEVKNNYVAKHRDGIYLEFVDESIIEENISEDNLRYGLHFMFSNDDDYVRNQFRRNGAGVAVMFSKKINMYENIFEHNWGKASYGLLLKEIYDAEILYNTFDENTIAIYVEGSTRVNYKQNDFLHNGWAIKISGGCLDNNINENNFIQNSFDLAINSAPNNNNFDRNYWSEYSAYDLDRDGIGDVPFRPVKLFNYVVNKTPESIVLLRSFFVSIINFSEKVSPAFTPKKVVDNTPYMNKVKMNKSYGRD